MCYLGIDIGTSSICGVVYHTSSKKIRSITRENGAGIVSSNTWEKAQDAEAIVRIVRSLIDMPVFIHGVVRERLLIGQKCVM